MINIYEQITNGLRQKIVCLEDSKCRNLEVRKIPMNWEDQSKFWRVETILGPWGLSGDKENYERYV